MGNPSLAGRPHTAFEQQAHSGGAAPEACSEVAALAHIEVGSFVCVAVAGGRRRRMGWACGGCHPVWRAGPRSMRSPANK